MMRAAEGWLYEELADLIEKLVSDGTLKPGSRAPSLRRISKDRGVSLSTALEAYRRLEARGLLEARQRSGFYVAKASSPSLDPPKASSPDTRPSKVTSSAILHLMLERASDPDFAPLGCAVPSGEILASDPLDRALTRLGRSQGRSLNSYAPPQGSVSLREQISRRMFGWGQATSPSDIVITAGCTEALALALGVLCRPGGTIAVESPTYFGHLRIAQMLGLSVLELPADPISGVDPATLADLTARHRIKACLLSSSFANPGGWTVPDEAKAEIVATLASRNIALVEDDTYGDVHFGPDRPRPYSAFDPAGNVLHCASFSKVLAPGYRVGWLVAGKRLEAVLDRKFASTLCNPTLPQAALAEFLATGGYDRHLRRVRSIFADNVADMTRAVARHFPRGTRISRPGGGFSLWIELGSDVDTHALLERALRRSICFAPGHLFSARMGYSNCLRLSCGAPWNDEVEDAVAWLGQEAARLSA